MHVYPWKNKYTPKSVVNAHIVIGELQFEIGLIMFNIRKLCFRFAEQYCLKGKEIDLLTEESTLHKLLTNYLPTSHTTCSIILWYCDNTAA